MDFKGSKTEQNINTAFVGESIARSRYVSFAQGARNEGREDIAELFDKMAQNEKEHAKLWFRTYNDGYGSAADNLQKAASEENYEWKQMYPVFAKKAREEGFWEIAALFDRIMSIEYDHERKFTEALIQLAPEVSTITPPIKEGSDLKAYCMFCGNTSEQPPEVCPICEAVNSYTD